MCGIAGLLGSSDAARAERMIASIAHRGPDGIRVEVGADYAFAHARLSIIDLEGGWQPLHAAGAEVIGVGEIYNYLELAREHGLEARLATGSDFEPLLHLYAREGAAALARLRGMYALCLRSGSAVHPMASSHQDLSSRTPWKGSIRDPGPRAPPSVPAASAGMTGATGGAPGGDGAPLLSRDPFGIKPLYGRSLASGAGVAFASEPRALLLGERPAMNREAAHELLALNYTVGERTIFEGVRRVAPGATLDAQSQPLQPPPTAPFAARLRPPEPVSEAEALRTLDAVLEDSVRVHQRSDVPYGLFLSGGVDSAAIATLMARLNTRPVIAYTCGFEAADIEGPGIGGGAADERRGAERVARALDLDWRETTFTAEDFWRIAPHVAWALDDPTTDFATLPTYKLAEAAKGELTVVLTGEGGDELFGGYGRYRRALRPRLFGGRPAEPQVGGSCLTSEAEQAALDRWREAAAQPALGGLTRLQRAQAADVATWLPNDLLLKLDRCLMAHGLEGRTPFLDREVADFAFALPDRLKVRGRHGKWLLRRWLERACPAVDAFARKQGFTVPVERWIAPRARDLGPRIVALQGVREVCDVEAVASLFDADRPWVRRWPLVFFALWWCIHIDGSTVEEARARVFG